MSADNPETPDEQSARLKRFVLDYCDGRIFTSADLQDHGDARMVFMPLGLMDAEQLEALKEADPGVIYEHMDQAGPRSINGMPCFFSFKTLTRDEWKRAVDAIVAEMERRKAVTV